MKKRATDDHVDKDARQPHRVRLPGFISDEDIGLGDVIKQAAYAIQIGALRWLRTPRFRTQPLDGFLWQALEVNEPMKYILKGAEMSWSKTTK